MESLLGNKIYKARKAKGFSQEYLAELVGVSRQTISQWENDKFQPNNDNIDLLCQVFNMSREEFVGSADGADYHEHRNNDSRKIKQKVFTISIAVISSVVLILTIVTVMLGFICLTSNIGDMTDNSYSIPQYVLYVVLTLTVILILVDAGIIILKIKDKNIRL